MTNLLHDILAQPTELARSLAHTLGPGRPALDAAARLCRRADHLYLTGIGSSWHAGMAVQSLFTAAGTPAHLVDASELLHFLPLPPNSAVVALSRSGRSVEIVRLIDKVNAANATLIAVTNTPDSPLARHAHATLLLSAAFDHNVSITMYSALTLVGGLLATAATGNDPAPLGARLDTALRACAAQLPEWRDHLARSPWTDPDPPTYFLARGGSLATCHEAGLLWEEAAKAPAAAMTTGGFRHGPQEVAAGPLRVALWFDPQRLRDHDLALANDLRARNVRTLAIGQSLPPTAADLVVNLPPLPADWQFLCDVFPAQLAAETSALKRRADPDRFQICPYIIESEGGLSAASSTAGPGL